jgi:hypothetical protein
VEHAEDQGLDFVAVAGGIGEEANALSFASWKDRRELVASQADL